MQFNCLEAGVWCVGHRREQHPRLKGYRVVAGVGSRAHSSLQEHTPPLHQSWNSHGRQETTLHREVFPNEMDPIHTASSLTLGLGTTLVRSLF